MDKLGKAMSIFLFCTALIQAILCILQITIGSPEEAWYPGLSTIAWFVVALFLRKLDKE